MDEHNIEGVGQAEEVEAADEQVDESRITDDQAVYLNGEQVTGGPVEVPYDDEGNLKEGFKGPDPAEWGTAEDAAQRERDSFLSMSANTLREIAGQRGIPGRSQMNKGELVDEILSGSTGPDGLPIGHVSEDGQTKGPGAQWERDENGELLNR